MSLETLLEAAQFLEWSGEPNAKARVKPPTDFHRYAKSASKEVIKPEPNGSDPSVSDGNSEDESGNKRRPGGAGTREVHNKLEKNRRAHLKDCFDALKRQIPHLDDKKMSNLNILRCALRHIQLCKKKEKELEMEKQKVAGQKTLTQQRIILLRQELADMNINVDINHFITSAASQDETHSSASTATADNEEPIMSENEEGEGEDIAPPAKRLKTLTGTEAGSTLPSVSPLRDDLIDVVSVTPSMALSLLKAPTPHTLKTQALKSQAATTKKAASPPKTNKVLLPDPPQSGPPTVLLTGQRVTSQPMRWTVDPVGSVGLKSTASIVSATNTSTTSVSTASTKPVRMPVTQILQQTLALRAQQQQLQQKQKMLQAQAQAAQVQLQTQTLPTSTHGQATPAVITLTNNTGVRPTMASSMRPTIAQLRPTIAISPAVLPSLLSPGASILTAANLAAVTKATTSTTSVPTPTIATLTKLPTASVAMPTTPALTSVKTLTIATPAVTTSSLRGDSGNVPGTVTTPALALGNLGGLKQIITTPVTQIPTAQLVTPAQLQAIMSQAIAQQGNNQAMSTLVSPTVTQIGSLQSIQTVPLTQLVSPVTVMSPGSMQVSPALNQTQLSHVVSSQVLKSLGITGQIPILQQPLGLPVPPIVMVTMPSVVTTTSPSTPAIQVNVAVTETS